MATRVPCPDCEFIADQPTLKAARAQLAHHFLDEHNETDL